MSTEHIFTDVILGQVWEYHNDPNLLKRRYRGLCVYSENNEGGTVLIHSDLPEEERLEVVIHETFHAAFPAFVEFWALDYGQSAADMLLCNNVKRKRGRSLGKLRILLLKHSEHSLPDLLRVVRSEFTNDLARILKQDGWSV